MKLVWPPVLVPFSFDASMDLMGEIFCWAFSEKVQAFMEKFDRS